MSIINNYCMNVDKDGGFAPNKKYGGFIKGHDVKFINVKVKYYDEYFGQLQGYYGSNDFKVLQLVYPNTMGVWPDNKNANEWFKKRQPLLK